jgi:hypothetical protein
MIILILKQPEFYIFMHQQLDQEEENQKNNYEPVTLKFSIWLEVILQVMTYVIF